MTQNGSLAHGHAMIRVMGEATELWLVRHGETEWSRDARHTSVTDLPLLPSGEADARVLQARLAGQTFDLVSTSPRLRARRTAELAGYPDAVIDADLAEWAYGAYEGLGTAQIRASVPAWTIWTHGGGLGGETVDAVTARLDRLIGRVRRHGGRVLCFSHGHALTGPRRTLDRPAGCLWRVPGAPHGEHLGAPLRCNDRGHRPLERLSFSSGPTTRGAGPSGWKPRASIAVRSSPRS